MAPPTDTPQMQVAGEGRLNAHRLLPMGDDVEQPCRSRMLAKGHVQANLRMSKTNGSDENTLQRSNSRRRMLQKAKSERSLQPTPRVKTLSMRFLLRSTSERSLNEQMQQEQHSIRTHGRPTTARFVPNGETSTTDRIIYEQGKKQPSFFKAMPSIPDVGGQHASRSKTDRTPGVHPLERRRDSVMFGLDAMKGVTLNLMPTSAKQSAKAPSRDSEVIDETLMKEFSESSEEDSKVTRRKQLLRSKEPSQGDLSVSMPPMRDCAVVHVKQDRRLSNLSHVSDLSCTNLDESIVLTKGGNFEVLPHNMRDKKSLIPLETMANSTPNHPHPALEYPPLYFAIRRFPCLLELAKKFFHFRWRLSYPLQRRIPLTRSVFRKMNVFVTLGELLLMLPFFATIIICTIYSFSYPSVSISGHAARTPLIFAFVTAMKNSFLTLLLGIPFERAIWYHKLSARLAYVCGFMHTYVAFVYPNDDVKTVLSPVHSWEGSDPNFGKFMFSDEMHSAGTMLMFFMTAMMITALPIVRRKVFEVFYFLHVIFAASMIACAFYHTGYLVPILGALTWGVDLFIPKFGMALCRYPRKASLRIISESVVELCFPKTDGFDYNPGQYVYLAIPELSVFEWHPFSLSSSPEQKVVTLHIRKAGCWTGSLYELAKKQMEVSILLEGPYGSVGVDLTSDRYKMVMLFSGGIGVTPMQALCNQLMYEQSTAQRELKRLSFIWIERDPNVMQKVDVVRRRSCARLDIPVDLERGDAMPGIVRGMDDGQPQGIASTLLSLVPVSAVTDEQLEEQYPSDDFDDLDEQDAANDDGSLATIFSNLLGRRKEPAVEVAQKSDVPIRADDDTLNQSFLDAAYNHEVGGKSEPESALDLQVYLTNRSVIGGVAHLPFVQLGRPDIKQLFINMREEAIAKGEHRVAVCVCAPKRLVTICQKASAKYSDKKVRFDFHYEVFD